MQSLLLTGKNKDEREKKAREIALETSSKFDLLVIDGESTPGIAAAKEILPFTARKPYQGKSKSILILEADNLTPEAQNFLLKNLEEPTETTQIILTCSTAFRLLKTVTSRLQEINLGPQNSFLKSESGHWRKQNLSEKLDLLEKTPLDQLLIDSRQELLNFVINSAQSEEIKKMHQLGHLLLKMRRAQELSINKKLINLILALES